MFQYAPEVSGDDPQVSPHHSSPHVMNERYWRSHCIHRQKYLLQTQSRPHLLLIHPFHYTRVLQPLQFLRLVVRRNHHQNRVLQTLCSLHFATRCPCLRVLARLLVAPKTHSTPHDPFYESSGSSDYVLASIYSILNKECGLTLWLAQVS